MGLVVRHFFLSGHAAAVIPSIKVRRRIAATKAQDYADLQSGIRAGICAWRNGLHDKFAADGSFARNFVGTAVVHATGQ